MEAVLATTVDVGARESVGSVKIKTNRVSPHALML